MYRCHELETTRAALTVPRTPPGSLTIHSFIESAVQRLGLATSSLRVSQPWR